MGALESRMDKIESMRQRPEGSSTALAPPSGQVPISQVKGLEDFMYNKFREMSDLIKDGIENNTKSMSKRFYLRSFYDSDTLMSTIKTLLYVSHHVSPQSHYF